MSEVLRGVVTGNSRSAIRDKIERIGEAFFDTPCQLIQLFAITARSDKQFEAEFATQEHHQVTAATYGPGKCARCGEESWPSRPLPTASPTTRPPTGATNPADTTTQEEQ